MNKIDEYLDLNERSVQDVQKMYFILKEFINFTKGDLEDLDSVLDLPIHTSKFWSGLKYFGVSDDCDLKSNTKEYIDCFQFNIQGDYVGTENDLKDKADIVKRSASESFSLFIDIMHKGATSLHGFFDTEYSNKEKATDLILQAIKIINADSNFNEKARTEITNQLHEAIKDLENSDSSKSNYFSIIFRTITILGALGAFVGGGIQLKNMIEAKNLLQESLETVSKTSINVNFKTMNYILNSESKTIQINEQSNEVFLLPKGEE